jgi:hypothetical protein
LHAIFFNLWRKCGRTEIFPGLLVFTKRFIPSAERITTTLFKKFARVQTTKIKTQSERPDCRGIRTRTLVIFVSPWRSACYHHCDLFCEAKQQEKSRVCENCRVNRAIRSFLHQALGKLGTCYALSQWERDRRSEWALFRMKYSRTACILRVGNNLVFGGKYYERIWLVIIRLSFYEFEAK